MTVVAKLYPEARAAPRVRASRNATLRDATARAIDVVIEDLSVVGFGMSTTTDLAVGAQLKLRLAGIAKRDVRVVRRFGLSYGCEFTPPLAERDLATVLSASSMPESSFVLRDATWQTSLARTAVPDKFSPLLRLGVLLGAIGLLWAVIISTVGLILR